jgi:WhiB family transcriptional regulator, redox-sensing transcriptional regulator
MRYALCRGVDRDLFFSGTVDKIAKALTICSYCPVRGDLPPLCRGGPTGPSWGVWGGTTEKERRRMRRARRVA